MAGLNALHEGERGDCFSESPWWDDPQLVEVECGVEGVRLFEFGPIVGGDASHTREFLLRIGPNDNGGTDWDVDLWFAATRAHSIPLLSTGDDGEAWGMVNALLELVGRHTAPTGRRQHGDSSRVW